MVQGADRRICGDWDADRRLKITGYWKNGLRVSDGRLKALSCRLLAKRCVLFVLDDVKMFEMGMKIGSIKSLSTINYQFTMVAKNSCTYLVALVLEYGFQAKYGSTCAYNATVCTNQRRKKRIDSEAVLVK